MENPLSRSQSVEDSVYAESFGQFLALGMEKTVLLEKIFSSFAFFPGTALLDIGAGNGELTIPLSRLSHTTVAIEPNAIFAETLRGRGIECLTECWEDAVVSDGSFDIVLAAFVVCHLATQGLEASLARILRTLRPGGHGFFCAMHPTEGDWRALHTLLYQADGQHFRVSSSVFLQEYMQRVGAKREELHLNLIAKTKEEILDALRFDFVKTPSLLIQEAPQLDALLDSRKTNDGYVIDMVIEWYDYVRPQKLVNRVYFQPPFTDF